MKICTIIALSLFLAVATNAQTQNRSDAMVKKLRGLTVTPAAKPAATGTTTPSTEPKTRGFKTRSFSTRSIAPTPAAPAPTPGETRSLYLTRGLRSAQPMKAFFGDPNTKVEEVKAPATNPNHGSQGDIGVPAGQEALKVSYTIDPSSELKGEVFFTKGTATIKGGESYLYLADLARALQNPQLQGMKFIIEGHASADGNAIYNKNLSQQRANSILYYLIGKGVNANCIYPAGFGEDLARYPAGSPDSLLAQDRRVLIYKLQEQ